MSHTKSGQQLVLVGILALVVLGAFESMAVTTAMPAVARELDAVQWYALAFAATMAASVVGTVLGGGWSDRSGPTAPLYVGVGAFVAGLIVCGLAPNMPLFIAGRVIEGVGQGIYIVALYVVVARVFDPQRRASVFAWFAACWVVPSIVGPALAGIIVEWIGWRWVFLLVPILVVPALALMIPGLRPLAREPVPPASGALAAIRRSWWALGAACAAGVLHVAGGYAKDGPAALPWVVAALAVGTAACLVCTPKLVPRGTLTARRGLPSVIGLRAVLGSSFFSVQVVLEFLLQHQRGMAPAPAGLVLAGGSVAWALGSWLRGRNLVFRTPRDFLVAGCAAAVCGGLLVWPMSFDGVSVWFGIVGCAIGGFGMGLIYPTLATLTLDLSAREEQGFNSSALTVAEALATSVVLALTGSVLGAFYASAPLVAYGVSLGLCVALAALGLVLAPRAVAREAINQARVA